MSAAAQPASQVPARTGAPAIHLQLNSVQHWEFESRSRPNAAFTTQLSCINDMCKLGEAIEPR